MISIYNPNCIFFSFILRFKITKIVHVFCLFSIKEKNEKLIDFFFYFKSLKYISTNKQFLTLNKFRMGKDIVNIY